MKTAISIPDDVFQAGEAFARRTGLSRSELYALALKTYLGAHEAGRVTEGLDEVYGREVSAVDPVLARLQGASLVAEEW